MILYKNKQSQLSLGGRILKLEYEICSVLMKSEEGTLQYNHPHPTFSHSELIDVLSLQILRAAVRSCVRRRQKVPTGP